MGELKKFLPILFFVLLFGCAKPSQNDKVVATVDGDELTIKMIQENVDSGTVLNNYFVMEYASSWASEEMLYKEAIALGYDRDEDVEKALQSTRRQLAIQKFLQRNVFVKKSFTVPDSAVKNIYFGNKVKLYLKNDVALLTLLFFNSEGGAKNFRVSLLRGGVWNKQIEISQKSISIRFDSVYREEESLANIWGDIKKLSRGEISQPIYTQSGWVVARLWKYYYAGDKSPLEYIEPIIREELAREENNKEYSNYISTLKKKYKTKFYYSD